MGATKPPLDRCRVTLHGSTGEGFAVNGVAINASMNRTRTRTRTPGRTNVFALQALTWLKLFLAKFQNPGSVEEGLHYFTRYEQRKAWGKCEM